MFARMTQYLKDISFTELVCKGNSLQNLKKKTQYSKRDKSFLTFWGNSSEKKIKPFLQNYLTMSAIT